MHRAWSTYLDANQAGSQHGHAQSMEPGGRPDSVLSNANSAYSHSSTRHLMDPLPPPNAPFAAAAHPIGSSTSLNSQPLLPRDNSSPVSLSVNYLPSKFSSNLHARKRKSGRADDDPLVPKRGGGRDAFRAGEARMPGAGDDDYDGLQGPLFGGRKKRWNRFKWTLFVANILLTMYSLVALIFCLLTHFNVWTHADVVRVGNTPELVISTLAAALGLLTAMIGWSGILLNNRSFLAVYTFLLWVCFALLVAPGYITYKRRTFNLEGKVNSQWSRDLGASGRLRIQNQLQCCGYYSPFVEATVSQTCYARSILPGCKSRYLKFERLVLGRWFLAAFALVPLHIAITIAGLLCSNHVTYRFGKGMMPKAYRLSMNSMAVIMENYAQQLAEQYGTDVASEVLARSRSNLNIGIPADSTVASRDGFQRSPLSADAYERPHYQ